MEEKELWMNKLKEKLADYSEPAPASGWEQLEKELMPPVEKKIYPYRKWMMAAMLPRGSAGSEQRSRLKASDRILYRMEYRGRSLP